MLDDCFQLLLIPLILALLCPFLDECLPCNHLGQSIRALMNAWKNKEQFRLSLPVLINILILPQHHGRSSLICHTYIQADAMQVINGVEDVSLLNNKRQTNIKTADFLNAKDNTGRASPGESKRATFVPVLKVKPPGSNVKKWRNKAILYLYISNVCVCVCKIVRILWLNDRRMEKTQTWERMTELSSFNQCLSELRCC